MEMIEIELHIHHETELAVLVSPDGFEDDAVWLPFSQIMVDHHNPEYGTFQIPEWLAEEKGLI